MRRILDRAWTLGFAAACGLGCSLVTSLDGLSGDASATIPDGGTAARADAATLAADADTPVPPAGPPAWRAVPTEGPSGRHSARMAYDPRRRVSVLFGGSDGDVFKNDTWEFDGAAWTQRVLASPPSERSSPGLAYDTARGALVVVAGQNARADVWELGDDGWTSRGQGGLPSRIAGSAAAYDPKNRVTIVFGGHDERTDLDSTYAWDGAAMTKLSPSAAPSPRRGARMVYDQARETLVLFGGHTDAGSFDEVWLFDGSTWRLSPGSPGPSPRVAGCMAYDARRRAVVVFGGRGDKNELLADTWLWDGASWARGPDGPPARRTCAMTHDATRGATVMFGGAKGNRSPLRDTWVLE